jgi:hypothetical protein
MTESETPRAAHEAFNALCDGLEDYEPLPTTTSGTDGSRRTQGSGSADGSTAAERSGAPTTGAHLDAEILAGLVNP